MNYMEQIAKMFGVELREKFKLKNKIGQFETGYYQFAEDGLLFHVDGNSFFSPLAMRDLLVGELEIEIPWKPKEGDIYHFINIDGSLDYDTWNDYLSDFALYKLGKIYRTREEAEAHLEEDYAFWDEIQKELES